MVMRSECLFAHAVNVNVDVNFCSVCPSNALRLLWHRENENVFNRRLKAAPVVFRLRGLGPEDCIMRSRGLAVEKKPDGCRLYTGCVACSIQDAAKK